MIHSTPQDRRALIDRVGRTLQGERVSRSRVVSAVDAVLMRLDDAAAPDASVGARRRMPAVPAAPAVSAVASLPAVPAMLAAFTARSAPDLASRVRRGCEQAGVRVLAAGSATSGRHTVVTARVPVASRAALDGVAIAVGAALSVHEDCE